MTYHAIVQVIDPQHVGYVDPQTGLAWAESLSTHIIIALHPSISTHTPSIPSSTERTLPGADAHYRIDHQIPIPEGPVRDWLLAHCQCGGQHPEPHRPPTTPSSSANEGPLVMTTVIPRMFFRCHAQYDAEHWDLWDGTVLRFTHIDSDSCPVALHHWCVGSFRLTQTLCENGTLTATASFCAHADLGSTLPSPIND
jgi:hypothetical protein